MKKEAEKIPARNQKWKDRRDSGRIVIVEEYNKAAGLVAYCDADGQGYGQEIEGFLKDFIPTGRNGVAPTKIMHFIPKCGLWRIAKGKHKGRVVNVDYSEVSGRFYGRSVSGTFIDSGRRMSWNPEDFLDGKRFVRERRRT